MYHASTAGFQTHRTASRSVCPQSCVTGCHRSLCPSSLLGGSVWSQTPCSRAEQLAAQHSPLLWEKTSKSASSTTQVRTYAWEVPVCPSATVRLIAVCRLYTDEDVLIQKVLWVWDDRGELWGRGWGRWWGEEKKWWPNTTTFPSSPCSLTHPLLSAYLNLMTKTNFNGSCRVLYVVTFRGFDHFCWNFNMKMFVWVTTNQSTMTRRKPTLQTTGMEFNQELGLWFGPQSGHAIHDLNPPFRFAVHWVWEERRNGVTEDCTATGEMSVQWSHLAWKQTARPRQPQKMQKPENGHLSWCQWYTL